MDQYFVFVQMEIYIAKHMLNMTHAEISPVILVVVIIIINNNNNVFFTFLSQPQIMLPMDRPMPL